MTQFLIDHSCSKNTPSIIGYTNHRFIDRQIIANSYIFLQTHVVFGTGPFVVMSNHIGENQSPLFHCGEQSFTASSKHGDH